MNTAMEFTAARSRMVQTKERQEIEQLKNELARVKAAYDRRCAEVNYLKYIRIPEINRTMSLHKRVLCRLIRQRELSPRQTLYAVLNDTPDT